MAGHSMDGYFDGYFNGYCDACKQNVPHIRRIHNPTLNRIDKATFRLSRFFRLGSWHCIQCGVSSLHLGKPRRHVPTFETSDLQADPEETESVGNFIQGTKSLLLRRSRANRFSEKYRDSIVHRLMSGSTTISQLGRELELSEVDIVDWIADLLARKQTRIEELDRFVRSLPQATERLIGFDPGFEIDENGGGEDVDVEPNP